MASVKLLPSVPPLASVTVTTKTKVPAALGVPEIVPAELSANPPGSAPEVAVNDRAPVPPITAIVWL